MHLTNLNTIVPLIVIALGHVPTVFGWGAAGHEIVATIAQIHLHPSVLPNICSILNYTSPDPKAPLCHLAPIATWADRIRMKMRWSGPLHYIGAVDDYPSQTCAFPGERGWAGKRNENVFGAIRNYTHILEEWSEDVNEQRGWEWVAAQGEDEDEDFLRTNEALKFLVHFLGDMHMPLHLTGRDRGGNSDKVLFDGRQTNLHSVWDGSLIAKGLRSVPSNYSRPLPFYEIEHNLRGTIYDSYVRRIMWEGILGKWRDEIPNWLACPSTSLRIPKDSNVGLWEQVMSLWSNNGAGDDQREADDDVICPYAWAAPIHKLNCEIVWPKELDEPPYGGGHLRFADKSVLSQPASHAGCHSHRSVDDEDSQLDNLDSGLVWDDLSSNGKTKSKYLELDTPEYAGVISKKWIIEKLLAQGGIRLAGVLNYLFADLDSESGYVKMGANGKADSSDVKEGERRGLSRRELGLRIVEVSAQMN